MQTLHLLLSIYLSIYLPTYRYLSTGIYLSSSASPHSTPILYHPEQSLHTKCLIDSQPCARSPPHQTSRESLQQGVGRAHLAGLQDCP
eukprot:COSAG05_NODE_61_length_23137_cov_22.080693_5_plen_88_part_00